MTKAQKSLGLRSDDPRTKSARFHVKAAVRGPNALVHQDFASQSVDELNRNTNDPTGPPKIAPSEER
jgi:hypothetical protein